MMYPGWKAECVRLKQNQPVGVNGVCLQRMRGGSLGTFQYSFVKFHQVDGVQFQLRCKSTSAFI